MDAQVEFTYEMFPQIICNRTNENTDLFSTLVQRLGNIEADVKIIKAETHEINQKVDVIKQIVESLENSFSELKAETRDIDQKILLMTSKLDKIEKSIPQEALEDYYGLCQSIYTNWDELEELTRKLIPVAEYLFSSLQKYQRPDYSPVILELCRSIETEFLFKIFSKYTIDLVTRKDKDLDNFLATDCGTKFLRNKTSTFAKRITKASKTKRPEYTLGEMNTVMSLMNEAKTVNASPLLQDFKKYLGRETVLTDLLDVQYINKINDLVKKFRNPAAHPGIMSLSQAQKCKEIMPERIDYLMDCLA